MQFVRHPHHSRYMGKPRDWDERKQGPCGDLSVHETQAQGMHVYESAWETDISTALRLALDVSQLRLGIIGSIHPPVYMAIASKGEQTLAAKLDAYKAVLVALLAQADADDISLCIDIAGDAHAYEKFPSTGK